MLEKRWHRHAGTFDQSTPKAGPELMLVGQRCKWSQPFSAVLVEEVFFSSLQFFNVLVSGGVTHVFELGLHTDELREWIALFFEPIREDQSERQILRRMADGVQKLIPRIHAILVMISGQDLRCGRRSGTAT
jgi:hypothetical protein